MNLGYFFRRVMHRLHGQVVHLKPNAPPRGNVLISYTTLPYVNTSQRVLGGHTNKWECMQMAREFLSRDYTVDVIDSTNQHFTPQKTYHFFLDVGSNMDRIAPLLSKNCVKIFHITHAHWKYQNDAEAERIAAIEMKRGAHIHADRQLPPSRAIELCDIATSIAGDFANSTYAFAKKEIVRLPLSTSHTFPSPAQKDMEQSRRNFIWFGGAGLALKGLDLVLEAFTAMPEYRLTVCGKVSPADPFVQAYRKELYETANIRTCGLLDPAGEQFAQLRRESLAIVFPSFSEGCAGSVVLCMHAGLIPIVSKESGVEVEPFGVTLRENAISTIQSAVRELAILHEDDLRSRTVNAWNYALAHYTREKFAGAFSNFMDQLESRYE